MMLVAFTSVASGQTLQERGFDREVVQVIRPSLDFALPHHPSASGPEMDRFRRLLPAPSAAPQRQNVIYPFKVVDDAGAIRVAEDLGFPPATLAAMRAYAASSRCKGEVVSKGIRAQLSPSRDLRSAFMEFDKACFSSLDETLVGQLGGRIGVLFNTELQQFTCTAAAVSPSHILTARHCLFHPHTKKPFASGPSGLPLWFFPLDVPREGIRVLSATHPNGTPPYYVPHMPTQDFAVLQLASSRTVKALEWRAPPTDPRLIIVGLSNSAAFYSGRPPTPPDDAGRIPANGTPWTEHLRLSNSPMCRIWAQPDDASRCVVHACQTDPGMSGAPLLLAASPGTFIGIQVESIGSNHPQRCGWAFHRTVYNVGTTAEEAVRFSASRGGQ